MKLLFLSMILLLSTVGISNAMETKPSDTNETPSIPSAEVNDNSNDSATNPSSSTTDQRKRDIFFRTVATYKLGLDHADKPGMWILKYHPLVEGKKPYAQGNGGLLNPILKKYEIKNEPIKGDDYTGFRIEVSGHIAADGLAQYKFDKWYMGDKYYKHNQMPLLEEVILGYLKERTIDRQTSDISKACFHMASTPFADRFIACAKHEWTSKQNDQDTCIRTPQEDELIQRHMTRSTYWQSRWHDPKAMRTGEYLRKSFLDGDNDPLASVELNELEISVKIPGHDDAVADKDCSIQ